MQISRDSLPAAESYLIRGYGPEYVQVNDHELRQSFLLTPDTLDPDWSPESFSELETAHLDAALAHDPEIVLLGTGTTLRHPGVEFLGHVMRHGIGFEVMDTASACRTYNILMSESRRVVALFLFD